jgi:hypothetical protein
MLDPWIHRSALLLAALTTLACGARSGQVVPGEGPPRMRVVLTGAPPDSVAKAWVKVSQVLLVSDEQSVPIDLRGVSRSLFTYDLRWLDGVDVVLAEATVPAGRFDRLIIEFSHADVTLQPGYTLLDGRSVGRHEGPPRWVAVRLREPIETRRGTTTELRVDARACLRVEDAGSRRATPRTYAAASNDFPLSLELPEADRTQFGRL